jgi:hypothetical protein
VNVRLSSQYEFLVRTLLPALCISELCRIMPLIFLRSPHISIVLIFLFYYASLPNVDYRNSRVIVESARHEQQIRYAKTGSKPLVLLFLPVTFSTNF